VKAQRSEVLERSCSPLPVAVIAALSLSSWLA